MSMLSPKQRSEIEQDIATMRDIYPRTWRQLFLGCVKEGFTPAQSMDLVKTYILSQNIVGIRPSNDGGAPTPNNQEE